jgi:hypothetical protein
MLNLLTKTYVSLYKSFRGMLDLQLSYLSLMEVQLRNLEKNRVKQWYFEILGAGTRATRDVAPSRASLRTRARMPRHPKYNQSEAVVVGIVCLRGMTRTWP